MKRLVRINVKGFLLVILLTSLFNSSFSQQFLTKIYGLNAYVHLPDDYNQTTKQYPIIIFFPGIGEIGDNPQALLSYGPSKFINDGYNMQFTVNGVLEKPIVMSIQPLDAYPQPDFINSVLDAVVSSYRVDQSRLNVTGLSMGAFCADNYVTASPTYANRLTSIVALTAVVSNYPVSNYKNFANAGGKWWGFEGTYDNRGMDQVRDVMNAAVPGSARYTSFVGGHCCWNTWYDPNWRENGVNIYEWMLQQRKGSYAVAPSNQAPVAIAGSDINVTDPKNKKVDLDGSGSYDPDGRIVAWQWTQTSGPSQATIKKDDSSNPTISDLNAGTYVFNLTVTDNNGATGNSQVRVNVAAQSYANQPPVVYAGPDATITLPTNFITLNGTASDPDGTILGGLWTQTSGPSQSYIVNANTSNPTVTNLVQGSYVFNLAAIDDQGSIANSSVTVTVNAASGVRSYNVPPYAKAGQDQLIYLPNNTITLNGSGSYDLDGYITSYRWIMIKGDGAVILSPSSMITQVTNLQSGVYTFQLIITDNDGGTSISNATIWVKKNDNGNGNVVVTNPDEIALLNDDATAIKGKTGLTPGSNATLGIYPNPVESQLHIQYVSNKLEKVKVGIYDVQGKLLMNQEFVKDQFLLDKTLNVSSLHSGSYYVTVVGKNGDKTTSKMIKQ